MERKTLAIATGKLVQFKSNKNGEFLTLDFSDPGDLRSSQFLLEIPLNGDSANTLDPLLDAISTEEYVGVEIVTYS